MKCSIKRCAQTGRPIGEGLHFCAEHQRTIWQAANGGAQATAAAAPTIGRVVEEFMAGGMPRPETMGSIVDQAVGAFRAQWTARVATKAPTSPTTAKPRQSRRELALRALGFAPEAKPSQEDITRAYRRLARQHHPDKGGDPARMAVLNKAYEVLCPTVPT